MNWSARQVIHFLETAWAVIFVVWCLLSIVVGIIQTCKGKRLSDVPLAVEIILTYGWLAWVLLAFVAILYLALAKMFGLPLS